MKIIVAKQSGLDRIAYINATRINTFHADKNQYDERIETKIYFDNGKCEIEGDKTQEIANFISEEGDSGMLNLIGENATRQSFWAKKGI